MDSATHPRTSPSTPQTQPVSHVHLALFVPATAGGQRGLPFHQVIVSSRSKSGQAQISCKVRETGPVNSPFTTTTTAHIDIEFGQVIELVTSAERGGGLELGAVRTDEVAQKKPGAVLDGNEPPLSGTV